MSRRLPVPLIRLPPVVEHALDAIRTAGGRPLLVGGVVRDAVLGLATDDFDVEVYALGVAPLIAALERVGRVNRVGTSFGVLKLAIGGVELDVSLPRRESKDGRGHRGFIVDPDPAMTTREAAARRDFTINAMLWDPSTDELIDHFGGRDDLAARRLRHVGPAFADDPLRVLRGMQFAGRFRLTADPETLALSRRLLAEHDTLAVERVWGEWIKWAQRSCEPSAGLRYLADCGWRAPHPELEALDGCPQDPEWHPEGDVWTHTLLVLDHAATIAERDGLAATDRGTLVLAALCHDLGKPETTVTDENGRVRSPGHASCDATLERFLGRIGCPAKTAARVVALTRHHLSHMNFVGSARHVRRLARSLGEGGETIAMLARLVEADHGARPPLPGGLPTEMREMLSLAAELEMTARAPQPLLRGRDLIALGVRPGPAMGRMLGEAYELQLDGSIGSLEEATRWAAERVAAEPDERD